MFLIIEKGIEQHLSLWLSLLAIVPFMFRFKKKQLAKGNGKLSKTNLTWGIICFTCAILLFALTIASSRNTTESSGFANAILITFGMLFLVSSLILFYLFTDDWRKFKKQAQ